MSFKIGAVVVTYNRKELLVDTLKALSNQEGVKLDCIYVIDNCSTDGTFNFLVERSILKVNEQKDVLIEEDFCVDKVYRSKVYTCDAYYVRTYKNIGGAGGFALGMKMAYDDGCDWIWLMDDDGVPEKDCLKKLLRYVKGKDIICVAPAVVLPDGTIDLEHRRCIVGNCGLPEENVSYQSYSLDTVNVDMVSFVGPLISRKVVEKVGLPKKEFFIHHDDVEFSLRMRRVGNMVLIPSAKIVHYMVAHTRNWLVRNDNYFIKFDGLWKSYFSKRNMVWLRLRYRTNKVRIFLEDLRYILGRVKAIMLFADNKWKRVLFLLNCYIDGWFGIFDNEKPKRILYAKSKCNNTSI